MGDAGDDGAGSVLSAARCLVGSALVLTIFAIALLRRAGYHRFCRARSLTGRCRAAHTEAADRKKAI